MSGIIDLSQIRREKKELKKNHKSQKARDMEMVQVSATTIGMFIQAVQWAMEREFSKEHFEFLTSACNYQLTCFARAYGWPVEKNVFPVVLMMTANLDPETKQVVFDIDISGEMAYDVQIQLSAANPNLQPVEETESTEG